MQDFIRRKNIENLTKQLAGGRLDAAQRAYAEKKLAEEVTLERADELTSARSQEPAKDTAPC